MPGCMLQVCKLSQCVANTDYTYHVAGSNNRHTHTERLLYHSRMRRGLISVIFRLVVRYMKFKLCACAIVGYLARATALALWFRMHSDLGTWYIIVYVLAMSQSRLTAQPPSAQGAYEVSTAIVGINKGSVTVNNEADPRILAQVGRGHLVLESGNLLQTP